MTSSDLCSVCGEVVTIGNDLELNSEVHVHLRCFKCSKCGVQLSPSERANQASDKVFLCKDHRTSGFAKQLQERAKRSFKTALKGGTKMFTSPSGKKPNKVPVEVGVPTPVPIESPIAKVSETANEEDKSNQPSTEETSLQPSSSHAMDEFETVLDDDEEENGSSQQQPSTPQSTNVALDVSGQGSSVRRTSTSHSIGNFSTSPSMVTYGEVGSNAPAQFSTRSGGSQPSQPVAIQKRLSNGSFETFPITSPRENEERIAEVDEEVDEEEERMKSPLVSVLETEKDEEEEKVEVESNAKAGAEPGLNVASNVDDNKQIEGENGVNQQPEEEQEERRERSSIEEAEVSGLAPSPAVSSPDYQQEATTTAGEEEDDEQTTESEQERVEEENEETDKQMRTMTDPLNMLTTAVARELEVLPQSHRSANGAESEMEEEEPEQPWVYPPAFSGVSPIQVSVVDPDHLWMFIEGPLLERMAQSKVGGARRARFIASEALKPIGPVPIYSRYRNPYLHVYLIKCETLQDYNATIRPRLKAFREDVERREDPEWLIVLVESAGETKKVLEKLKLDFVKDRVVSVSVSEDARWLAQVIPTVATQDKSVAGKMRKAGDGQWGDLAQRVGTCIVRAYEHRRPLYLKSIEEEMERVMDWNYFSVFTRCESLAFASLQCDKYDEALEIYVDLNLRFKRGLESGDALIEKVVRCGMIDESGSSVKRLPCAKLLFPAVSSKSTEQDAVRAQIHRTFPARIFDVERLPFRDLIGTSTVSGIQLQMYLMSRIVLCLLAIGRAREAIETSRQFVFALRNNLRVAYPRDFTVIDAWLVAASLEIVAAGHACASVFAADVEPADRVGMCLAQAVLLERARVAMEQISKRETFDYQPTPEEQAKTTKYERRTVPALAIRSFPHLLRDTTLPPGLVRAFFSSPESFRTMYARLMEASAAHFVAAGRFRFAAAITHMRALLLFSTNSVPKKDADVLFEDACRWWGGGPRTLVFGEGTATVSQAARHDDWPSLKAETCLYTGKTERVAASTDLIGPQFRRKELSMRVAEDLQEPRLDMLVPIEVRCEGFAKQVTEDDEWRGQARIRFKLEQLEEYLGMRRSLVKCIVRFKLCATRSSSSSSDIEQKQQQQSSTIIFRDVESIGPIRIDETTNEGLLEMETIATDIFPCSLGVFVPEEAFVFVQTNPQIRLRALLHPKQPSLTVVERPFPYESEIIAPRILASGTLFTQNSGENDSVIDRQEFRLVIRPRKLKFVPKTPIRCEATLTCSDGFEFSETGDGKICTNQLSVIFEGPTVRKFSLVVSSKNRQMGGTAKLRVEMKTCSSSSSDDDQSTLTQRVSEPYEKDVFYCAPIRVAHEVRFAGGDRDVTCISLVLENNLPEQYASEDLEITTCQLNSISTEALDMKTSPIPPFPCLARPNSSIRQTFIIEGLDALVPNRVGGRSLILLHANIGLQFLKDKSQCVLSWYVPLVVRRAEIVRSKWKEGEGFTFARPAIEAAMFGIDWKELDEDVEAAPVISINDEPTDELQDENMLAPQPASAISS